MNDENVREIAPQTNVSMSDALKEWLDQQGVSTRVETEDPRALLDQADFAGLAAIVVKGQALKRIRQESEDDFQTVIKERDIANSTAYLCIHIRDLFNELGDLRLVWKAAQLGATRIRELKPMLDYAGVKQLISEGHAGDLEYDQVLKMSKRDIVDWRRRVEQATLARRRAEDKALLNESLATQHNDEEPRAVTVLREEAAELTVKMTAQIGLLQRGFAEFARSSGSDNASESLLTKRAAAGLIRRLREVHYEVEALDAAIVAHFHGDLSDEWAGDRHWDALDALRESWIGEVNEAADERAKARQKRYRWRGRPTKVAAVK